MLSMLHVLESCEGTSAIKADIPVIPEPNMSRPEVFPKSGTSKYSVNISWSPRNSLGKCLRGM